MWRKIGLPLVFIVAVGAAILFLTISQFADKHDKVRTVAGQVNSHVASGEILYAVNSRYQPFLFYVKAEVKPVESLREVPISANYLFVRPNLETQVTSSERWAPRHPVMLSRITDYRDETIVLFRIE